MRPAGTVARPADVLSRPGSKNVDCQRCEECGIHTLNCARAACNQPPTEKPFPRIASRWSTTAKCVFVRLLRAGCDEYNELRRRREPPPFRASATSVHDGALMTLLPSPGAALSSLTCGCAESLRRVDGFRGRIRVVPAIPRRADDRTEARCRATSISRQNPTGSVSSGSASGGSITPSRAVPPAFLGRRAATSPRSLKAVPLGPEADRAVGATRRARSHSRVS